MNYITTMPLFSLEDKVRWKTDPNKKGSIVHIEVAFDTYLNIETFRYTVVYGNPLNSSKSHTLVRCCSMLERQIELDVNYDN